MIAPKPEPGESLEQYRVRRVRQILLLPEEERAGYAITVGELMELIEREYYARLH